MNKQFLISLKDISNSTFLIKGAEFHHLKNVLRLKQKDIIFGITDDGYEYKGIIESFENKYALCKILNKKKPLINKNLKYSVLQSIIKEKKMSFILEKSTELSVEKLIPLVSERSSIYKSADKNKKIKRWNEIIKASIKQSGNIIPTKLSPILDIKDLNNFNFSCYDYIILLSPVAELSLENFIQGNFTKKKKHNNVLIIIGPEGGFTPEEEELFETKGAVAVTCANHLFRSETAFVYICSLFHYLNRK